VTDRDPPTAHHAPAADRAPAAELPGSSEAPGVVLDTNVVLDWLVFRDAATRPLARRLETRALRWLLAPALTDELMAVLERPFVTRWVSDRTSVADAIERWAHRVGDPAAARQHSGHRLECRDADDQKFIDLAVQLRVGWLVTRDRALLELARAARPLGVAVMTPAQWALACPEG
jgi:putative PIN family toxin of toxin-antitoxin system